MGIRLESARAFFKSETELTQWSVGNVGIEAIANPVFYPRIVEELLSFATHMQGEHLRMADFGAGSLRIERDLFCDDSGDVFGLRRLDPKRMEDFRAIPIQTIALESSDALLRMGRGGISESWTESNRLILRQTDLSETPLNLGEGSLDLGVSRNFLMNLSPRALRFHLCEVARALKPRRKYLAVVLNPEYQRRKLKAIDSSLPLKAGAPFIFPRGDASAQLGYYNHFFHRTLDYVDFFSQSGFEVADVEPLATPPGWESRVPRYYDLYAPVFLLITAFKI